MPVIVHDSAADNEPLLRYYEARLYKKAPVRSRPDDVLSFVASRTGYSRIFTNNLVSEGKTVCGLERRPLAATRYARRAATISAWD